MNYANIKNNDIANGDGIRVSLFVSGCTRRCKNCFNKEAWDFNYGKSFNKETEDYIISLLKPTYIDGISILGGEPMEPINQITLLPFLKKIKQNFGNNKNIWCYTGFTIEELLNKQDKITDELLSLIDVLVDGPYIDSQKDISLKFRGSSNQRIIDVPQTLKNNTITLYNT